MLEDTSESAITVTSVPTTGSMSAQEEEHYGHYIEQEQVHLIRCGKHVESTYKYNFNIYIYIFAFA